MDYSPTTSNGKDQGSFPSFGSSSSGYSKMDGSFPSFKQNSSDEVKQKPPTSKERIVLKVIVLGTSNAGKTSLMKRYVARTYSDLRRPTTGADFMTRQVIIDGEPALLQIWDTAGQERFHHSTLGHAFYRGADAALLVYDVSQSKSFDQIALWQEELMEKLNAQDLDDNNSRKFPIVVVGNKIDLLEGGSVPVNEENVVAWCQTQGVGHVKTSAKDGTGVDMAMQAIAQLAMLNKKRKIEQEKANPSQKKDFVDISKRFEANQNKKMCCPLL